MNIEKECGLHDWRVGYEATIHKRLIVHLIKLWMKHGDGQPYVTALPRQMANTKHMLIQNCKTYAHQILQNFSATDLHGINNGCNSPWGLARTNRLMQWASLFAASPRNLGWSSRIFHPTCHCKLWASTMFMSVDINGSWATSLWPSERWDSFN